MMTRVSDFSALTDVQLAALASMLEQQERFRLEQIAELTAPERSGRVQNDAALEIRATILFGARTALADIQLALARMADGTYGYCVNCGARQSPDRLEVLPHAPLCVTCQRAVQQPNNRHREFEQ
ncbi:TraR/DksA family transcriptional regulator [Jatrophihabitans sp. DSM 45814]